jgi:hypothetical protein
MKTQISVSPGQFFKGSLLLFVLAAMTGVLIFWLGWQKGMEYSLARIAVEPATPQSRANPDQSGNILPRAMTATPKPKVERAMIITNEDLLLVLNRQAESAGTEVDIQVQSVEIKQSGLTLHGSIDGLGFRGPVEITGSPAASGGSLIFILKNISIGGSELPQILYPTIEEEVNRYFEEWMWGYEVRKLELGEGTLTVSVLDW